MGLAARILKLAAAATLVTVVAGCTTLPEYHGYVPTEIEMEAVVVGKSTRDDVAAAIGTPRASGVLTDSGWYYVQSEWENFAYRAPREVSREVLAISFSSRGVVENIERFGLEDGQVVALSRRVTDSNIRGVSILRQIFRNFGKINTSQLFKDNGNVF